MPYRIDWEEPLGAYVKFTGTVTPEDLEQLIADIAADQRFDELRYVISDYLDAAGHSFGNLGEAVANSSAVAIGAFYSNPRLVEAAVVTQPGLVELARAYGSVTKFPFGVFPSVADARDWIASQSMSLRQVSAEQ